MSSEQLNEARVAMFKEQMKLGMEEADRWWDTNRLRLSMGFFSGFIVKLFALMSVSESPATMRRAYDTIRREVERTLKQTKQ